MNFLMFIPRTRILLPFSASPGAAGVMLVPSRAMSMAALLPTPSVFAEAPGWLYPSMMVLGHSNVGSGEKGVMTFTPPPGILKLIVAEEAQKPPALASVIACRSEPAPLSAVFVTIAKTGDGATPVTVSGSASGVAALAGAVTTNTESVSTPSAFGCEVISNVHEVAGANTNIGVRH